MRTSKELHPKTSKKYICELEYCPACDSSLILCDNHSGRKTVQTLSDVLRVIYWPKQCPNPDCNYFQRKLKSAEWRQIAPLYCTYGYDVIASIGWQRQTTCQQFDQIHADLSNSVQISESQVRYLYYQSYLPLLACHERLYWDKLTQVSKQSGLILTLDGLAPEGGEPQLWVVRELQTGLTLRSGWLSEQGQIAFENFLKPIADLDLNVIATMSDKQRGLLPAIQTVFPESKHALCQAHYLKNIAEPAAAADETMKVTLRKTVRKEVGDLIRPEHVEKPGVLTTTGLIPSPATDEEPSTIETEPVPAKSVEQEQGKTEPVPAKSVEQEQDKIVSALMRRVRYLLTLKGRPPSRLAGIEMFERLTEVSNCLRTFIDHIPDERLVRLQEGLSQSLTVVAGDYNNLRQVADWLSDISKLLDPDGKPPRTGAKVREQLFTYMDNMIEQSQENPILAEFADSIYKTTCNYKSGLFHTYDVPGLPRTNNDRESEFRDLNRRLLVTTGQKGATRRIIQRSGAWEVIPCPDSFDKTVTALSQVDRNEFLKERDRVRTHRGRFRLHTRSIKQARSQLDKLQEQWLNLPRNKSSG